MAKVIPLNNITYLDLPPDRILEQCKGELEGVVVIGIGKDDGDHYFSSSYADGGQVLWMLEKAKKALLEISAEDVE